MSSAASADFKEYLFGPWKIAAEEVFVASPHCFAFVNLKPVVPGHVLVSPKRVVARFAELSPEEVSDLWCLAQRVGSALEPHFGASSLTLAIQDGPQAGQTVPHVHVHILPRKAGDFENNDEVYDAIDAASKDAQAAHSGEKLDLDKERKVRTREEMAAEAAELRTLFK
ncbi:Bis(5 -adenosyl)-triphosphatase [Micractinium conductrix]|uniref:Bis(5 -adenosyl)-triphosphatase n=1 Tax=Micractinium conductrix TaxID=554055 RepID=A0A2P6VHL1_9CHLO|nr:Bis(5 -adenosyl)-triphosphatase [Micractinium conductrix]|eukprot:PSC73570.1 Bis(5 -adenosyl)-triphosphatase [Micractinium conductrix]